MNQSIHNVIGDSGRGKGIIPGGVWSWLTTIDNVRMKNQVTYFENTARPHNKYYRLEIERVLYDVGIKRERERFGWVKRERVEYFKNWREAERVYQKLY